MKIVLNYCGTDIVVEQKLLNSERFNLSSSTSDPEGSGTVIMIFFGEYL
jgi:hypothetical protein